MSDLHDDRPPRNRRNANGAPPLLGFGTQVILDGRAAAAQALSSRRQIEEFVLGLLDRVETDDEDRRESGPERTIARVQSGEDRGGPGVSAVVARGETAVMLHTFSDFGRLTMRLVSARSVPVDHVINEFRRVFGVGRSQSHVTTRFRAFPADGDELERFLAGERAYARLRLNEPLAP